AHPNQLRAAYSLPRAPAIDVIPRAEEQNHRRGDTDVVPPAPRGKRKVDDAARIRERAAGNLPLDCAPAVGAGGEDARVGLEDARDSERAPRGVGVIGAAVGD